MPDTDHELFALRQPPALRVFAVAVFVVWAAILVSITLSDDAGEAGPLWRLLPALMLAYGVVMMIRWQRMVVLARPEELMVRNPWRSRTVPRSAIAGFSTGRYQRVGHQTVRVTCATAGTSGWSRWTRRSRCPGGSGRWSRRWTGWRRGGPAGREPAERAGGRPPTL